MSGGPENPEKEDALSSVVGFGPLSVLYQPSSLATMSPDDLDGRPAPNVPTPHVAGGFGRYEDLGVLGRGATGVVHKVRDPVLGRILAMKVLRPEIPPASTVGTRFVGEARAIASLQHPGILPVHELGTLPDGRPYFTMPVVGGRSLRDVIRAVHLASPLDRWAETEDGWSFRRLIETMRGVCDAVAYAHDRGIVHRDLKPDNLLLGDHGEVLVVDWGLARMVGVPDRELTSYEAPLAEGVTRMGTVTGTPGYLAPEQALGRVDQIDARTDVYALGAVLFEVLYGVRPWWDRDPTSAIEATQLASPEIPHDARPVPDDVATIVARALSHEREERYANAGEVALLLRTWLDGMRRRERALAHLQEANVLGSRKDAALAKAARLRADADAQLASIAPHEPETKKSAAWALQDQAADLDHEAALTGLAAERVLRDALAHAPDFAEAHVALAELHEVALRDAEGARDRAAAARAEALLRENLEALPERHPCRVALTAALSAGGRVTLVTDPPGAEVALWRYASENRRLVPVFERTLGVTPLREKEVPRGASLLVLSAPGCEPVRYPIHVGRGELWEGGELRLPRAGSLAPDDVFVPGGPFVSGGDPVAGTNEPRRRLWVDSFVIRRFPVTLGQHVAFLDDLVSQGRLVDALRFAPRNQQTLDGGQGSLLVAQEGGRFVLPPDDEGEPWLPTWPAIMVDWFCATAHAEWEAARSGLPWRLPTADEWCKAGRGTDGRAFPWGDAWDPSWCVNRDCFADRPTVMPIGAVPTDESVYGVRDLAGNVRDWCSDEAPGGRRYDRGGYWAGTDRECRLCDRHEHHPTYRIGALGFRLARSA